MSALRKGVLLTLMVVLALCGGLTPTPAAAQSAAPALTDSGPDKFDVVIETLRLGALDMKARHVRPDGAGLSTMLIVHDTLGAYTDPLIERLQSGLAARGFASLAINLTLGESAREAPLDCNHPHTHRHEDAMAEIDAWTDWLLGQGLGPIVLVGHGRGGAQAAWRLARDVSGRIAAGILLAPTSWTPRLADAEYRARYAAGLSALLTRIAGRAPDDLVRNVPFLHCGAVDATKASIESYYGPQPMRDTATALANAKTPTLALMAEAETEGDNAFDRLQALKNPLVATRRIAGSDSQFSGAAFDAVLEAIVAYHRSVLPGR